MKKTKLVVVGNGMAGARAVEEVLSRGGERFDIVMFGAEPYGNYNRILLSSLLSGAQDVSEIFIHPLEWYERNAIKLHAGATVSEIDRSAKVVVSANGIREPYDKLLIATGSRAFIPPMAGVNLPDGTIKPGVFGFRTIDDCGAIIAKAKQSRRAAVIGGGLLGLEAARGLLNHGCEVHVVHLLGHLMEMQLDPTGGAILKSTMEAMGVKVHLGKLTSAVLGEDEVTGLAFKDGTTLGCDMVVVAAGIRPNAEIGARCGLKVGRAIVVDDHMRSVDDPEIYAVGECAEHRGRVYGLVAPLWDQAKVFAEHISGRNPDAAYQGSKLATKLKVMGVELASMGITEPAEERDEIIQYTEAKKGTYKKLIVRDGRLVGGILMGDISKAAYLMQCFDRDSQLPDERVSLLFDIGGSARKLAAAEMPADMQVCNCNGVSKATIAECFAGGVREAAAVMNATRAGKGCGSCKALVGEIVTWLCGQEAEGEPAVPAVAANAPPKAAPGEQRDLQPARIGKDAVFSVMPDMAGGVRTPAEFKRIAELALKYDVPLKEPAGRAIGLVGMPRDGLTGLWRDLELPAGYAEAGGDPICKTCIGIDFCRFGLGDSMGLAAKIEARFGGLDDSRGLELAAAGCPRNCPEAQTMDIGAVAIGDGNWEIYIGGAGGPDLRKGHLLCVVDNEDDVLTCIGGFIALYRAHGEAGEATPAFVQRFGIGRIRAAVGEGGDVAPALDAVVPAANGAGHSTTAAPAQTG
jgi:nitrite reductase (NADH) large subunit